jgi:pimeloyl-ACP methyl ester carboxylesterase
MMLSGELLQGEEKWCNRLQEIAVPTLIIHGTEDCVLPYAYNLALQAEIQGAVLLPLPRTGYELHRNDWSVILVAIGKQIVSP